ncbi:hypothetical protein FB567DRAFT_212378 [Paraphoma chrysanthemicola]|uniref:Uncharacterized protein n=1 Tax=Paraphoma chrysanthemicola TaxID=798071 RepID=A0A8K0VT85_9PLEO|nr:hypothetical protein FB567DRAFT_212378 [Paraphoma chrysanthemicola]
MSPTMSSLSLIHLSLTPRCLQQLAALLPDQNYTIWSQHQAQVCHLETLHLPRDHQWINIHKHATSTPSPVLSHEILASNSTSIPPMTTLSIACYQPTLRLNHTSASSTHFNYHHRRLWKQSSHRIIAASSTRTTGRDSQRSTHS